MKEHTLREFDFALNSLDEKLRQMAYRARTAVDCALSGITGDNRDNLNRVIVDDDELDSLEMDVDRDGLHILVAFSPVASDLRRVLRAIRLSGLYERIGDEAVNMAKFGRKLARFVPLREVVLLEPAAHAISSAFLHLNNAVTMPHDESSKDEGPVPRLNDVAAMCSKVSADMQRLTETHPDALSSVAYLIFIARCMERIVAGLIRIAQEASLMAEE